ncbi:MAG TPA: zinc ribbon domain-containing protein [Thermoanaerobaculia bacterium]|nr:zinc ribbon domain-containing protein [Thermoanaerobaculia bacterium]
MADEVIQKCPECGSLRPDLTQVCPACGAPPIHPGDKRATDNEVRTEDLEPYITLRYIARLFKVLAILMAVMMVGEIVTGLFTDGGQAILNLIGETTRLLVISGLLWAAGDITLLLIDAGHDLRVVRILLGRVNAELHRKAGTEARQVGVEQRQMPR